jgi:branched-chain amino acid transport system permease protein
VSVLLLAEQALNGVQRGIMLFLMAAGLTLVLGIMNLVNLAHGSLYMLGAYLAASLQQWTGSFALAAMPLAAVIGIAIEMVTLRTLYSRDHLDLVLCTFGLILFLNEMTRIVWGALPLRMALPTALARHGHGIAGHPLSRLPPRHHRRRHRRRDLPRCPHRQDAARHLIRAGASDRMMVGALGVDVKLLYTLGFGDHLSLAIAEGELHAVIGSNGAGKTTLVAQLAGEMRPSAGRVRFAGEDITGLGTPARSHRGLARSFQITSICREFSALDNVALAVQAHSGHSFRFWRAELPAGTLAHGEKRQLRSPSLLRPIRAFLSSTRRPRVWRR